MIQLTKTNANSFAANVCVVFADPVRSLADAITHHTSTIYPVNSSEVFFFHICATSTTGEYFRVHLIIIIICRS